MSKEFSVIVTVNDEKELADTLATARDFVSTAPAIFKHMMTDSEVEVTSNISIARIA